MLREDLISKLRLVAKIDALEDGSYLDEDGVLAAIADVADENDRLEREWGESRRRYADAFFNQPANPDNEGSEEEVVEEEIKIEDIIDL